MSAKLLQDCIQSYLQKNRKLCFYALVGIANTLTYFLVFNILLSLFPTQQPLPIVGYSAVGFLIANVQSYLLNRRWTFAAEHRHTGCDSSTREQILLYFLISLIALIINSLCFFGLQHLLAAFSGNRLWLNVESFFAGSLGTVWSYLGYQNIVFARSGDIQALAQDAECLRSTSINEQPEITLVIPVLDEATSIRQSLAEMVVWQQRRQLSLEVIIVDDGNTDQPSSSIQEFYGQMPYLSHYRFRQNWGKGGAVRYGLSIARGKQVFFTDTDLAFPLDQLSDLQAALEQGADIAVGCSRYMHQPLCHRMISALSRRIISPLRLNRAMDTQCGFKGFTPEALQVILPQTRCTNFAFNVEMLATARGHHLQIVEVPVQYAHNKGSSVHVKHTIQSLFSLLQFRYQLWKSTLQAPQPGPGFSDWTASIILFILALGVRLPYLYDVPNFSDEWGEVVIGYKIALGQAWPLHNAAHDIGALYNYLLAGLFTLFGSNIFLPRLFVAILSAATVVLTYWIARQWAPRLVAATAALLLAGNAVHILVTHMAWSNDTTPFFVALAILVSVKAASQSRSGWFAAAGLMWALALQTHSSVLALLPGIFIYFLCSLGWRSFSRDVRFWSATGAFLIGYSNMIINNIIIPLDSWTWMHRQGYALTSHPSPRLFIRDLWSMLSELGRSLASLPPNHGLPWWISIVMVIALSAGLLNGTVQLWRQRGGPLLPAVLISALILMPVFDHNFNFMVSSQYIACLFPPCFVAIAIGFNDWVIKLIALPFWESPLHPSWARRAGVSMIALAALLVFFMLPLQNFYVYAASQVEAGNDNSAAFETAQELATRDNAQWPVLVDAGVAQAGALAQMLAMEGLTSKMITGQRPATIPVALAGKLKTSLANLFNKKRATLSAQDFNQWGHIILQQGAKAWYLLTPEDADRLTQHFHLSWQNNKIVKGAAGKPAYFIGQIVAGQRPAVSLKTLLP